MINPKLTRVGVVNVALTQHDDEAVAVANTVLDMARTIGKVADQADNITLQAYKERLLALRG